MVLLQLREAGLQVDIDKCEFHVQETKFVSLLESTTGVKMDPERWKQSLLGKPQHV